MHSDGTFEQWLIEQTPLPPSPPPPAEAAATAGHDAAGEGSTPSAPSGPPLDPAALLAELEAAAARRPVPLFPPGRLLVMSPRPPGAGAACGGSPPALMVQVVPHANFGHLAVAEGMLENHSLEQYRRNLERLSAGAAGDASAAGV